MTDSSALWTPHVTVAAVVERDGRFLLVDEDTDEGRLYNQPAGHWDPGETLLEAAVRETREETGYEFTPRALVGVYHWNKTSAGITYVRFAFAGEVRGEARPTEPTVHGAVWMTVDEVRAAAERMRGPHVLACIEDHRRGRRWPLDLLVEVE